MARTVYAHVETEARDCDGMHYRDADYNMEDSELRDEFGDLEFYARIMSYIVSTGSHDGTLRVTQNETNGTPILEWSESTEEGYRHELATFQDGSI